MELIQDDFAAILDTPNTVGKHLLIIGGVFAFIKMGGSNLKIYQTCFMFKSTFAVTLIKVRLNFLNRSLLRFGNILRRKISEIN